MDVIVALLETGWRVGELLVQLLKGSGVWLVSTSGHPQITRVGCLDCRAIAMPSSAA